MKKTRKFAAATTVLAFIAVFLLGMSGVGSRLITTAQAATANGGREIIYYNDMVNEDDIGNNNFNFGPNRKEWAETAVKDGKAEDVLSSPRTMALATSSIPSNTTPHSVRQSP